MERMWSPWRTAHVRAFKDKTFRDTDGRSIFVQMAAADADETNLILWRGRSVFVVMNLYPYNNGHLMIVPYREVADYEALTIAEQTELAQALAQCLRWLRIGMDPDGFNVGMNLGSAGGAGIPVHLHMHVVPRWNGDTNFMPVVADAKVIPESLAVTYRKLRAVIDNEESSAM